MTIKFILLGSGSSMGVPRIDGYFGKCDPKNIKNYRTRCSAIIVQKKNNILIVELDNLGVIKNKKLLDLNDMNDLKYLENTTEKEFKNNNLLYNVFTSLREKINAPAKNRGK